MKCIICKRDFEPKDKDNNFCEKCEEIREELTNGKEGDE